MAQMCLFTASASKGGQRFTRLSHKSIYILYWRSMCEPDQQPANFIANPTFQNFSAGMTFSTFRSSSTQKWPVRGPIESVWRKCLRESIGVDTFWCVGGRRSVSLFVTLLATRSGQACFKYINQGIDPTPWPFLCVLSIILFPAAGRKSNLRSLFSFFLAALCRACLFVRAV